MFCKTVQYHQKSQQARDIGQFRLSPILIGILCLTPFPVFLPPSIAETEFVSVVVVVAVAETKRRDLWCRSLRARLYSGCAALPQRQNRFADFIKVGGSREISLYKLPCTFSDTIHQSFGEQ